MIELYKLRPSPEHLLPHEDQDALTFNELRHIFGTGLADRDLMNIEYMPLRLTGTPIGRTDLLLGTDGYPVMSWRLLRLLESLGDFPHQAIPAHLMQDRDDWQAHPPVDTTSFVVCTALMPRSTRDAIVAAGMLDIYMPPVHGGVIHLSQIHPV